ncbi:MAG: GNAT family N-acetyltransferase [Bacteroidia bacterium]|nr:GNAT family N-acetyltransferase [Bacteroidia bacterium]
MRKLQPSEQQIATDILLSAFTDIPLDNSINFVVKQDARKASRLRFLMHYLVNTTFMKGEVIVNDNNTACLLVLFPTLLTTKQRLRQFWWDLKLVNTTIGWDRVLKILSRQNALRKYHPKEPHIHPLILGVVKARQGKGIGIRLIREVLQAYSDNKLPVVIETTTNENIRLYQKFGFRILKQTEELGYPLTYLQLESLS